MKKIFVFMFSIFVLFSYSYSAENVLEKLKQPLIKEKNGRVYISHFDKVTFKEKVMILMNMYETAVVESYCEMPKGLIDVGYFTSICVSLTSGIEQDLFTPVFQKIKSVDWIFDTKNVKPDFQIRVTFGKKGLHVITRDKRGSRDFYVSYEEIVHTQVNP